MKPELIADVAMYPTDQGGKKIAALPGWGCPCSLSKPEVISKSDPLQCYDGWPLLGDTPLNPGDRRRLGFVFFSEDTPEILRKAKKFYLWEGRFIGEADVLE